MRSRIIFLFLVFTLAWFFILGRAVHLQVFPQKRLSQLKNKQFKTSLTFRSRRGTVFDRNGHELALSVSSYSLFADPKIIKDPYTVSYRLAKQLKVPRSTIYKKLKNKKRRFTWIQRQLAKETKNKIEKLGVYGLGFIEEPKRIYPNNHLLSQVLGFVGHESVGLEGIEAHLDHHINGQVKKITLQRDARGRPLIMDLSMYEPPKDGANVTLTVDSEIQYMLEKELSNAVHKYRAQSAMGVILDAQTSEVIAMANVPTFNVNNPFRYSPTYRKNRVVTDFYEPGSTIKPFLVAAALEEGTIKPNTKINCEDGRFKIGGRLIKEADSNHNFKFLTVSEVLAYSSNVGVSKIALKVGAQKVREYYSKYGFGQEIGVDLQGATQGLLSELPWRDHLLANISFGHGMAASALQVANAYTMIANGGVLKTPRIVKSVEGVTYEKPQGKRVMSESVAKIMQYMLTASTAKGSTGFKARVPGFQVAGKTGTAQKVDTKNGGYVSGAYLSSFAGFVPAHSPKFVIYIVIDDPQGKYYGSSVAAPLFSRVAGYALRKEGVEPILLSQSNVLGPLNPFKKKKNKLLRKTATIQNQEIKIMPDLKGLSLREVLKVFNKNDVKVNIKGTGLVVNTIPKPGEEVSHKVKIILEPYF